MGSPSAAHVAAFHAHRIGEGLDPDDCWPWDGNISIKGYGRLNAGGNLQLVHRIAYFAEHGAIPDETVDHECHNLDPECPGGDGCLHRRCCNPRHLVARSQVKNAVRATLAVRTGRCGQGHRMTEPEDVYERPGRAPACRQCHLRRQREYDERQRQAGSRAA